MRIFIYELKKLFSPIVLVCALALCTGLYIFMPNLNYDTADFYISHYLDNDKNTSFFTDAFCSEDYRVFKWYTDNYGVKVDDEVIKELETLTFPTLEKIIGEQPEFKECGIENLKDFERIYKELSLEPLDLSETSYIMSISYNTDEEKEKITNFSYCFDILSSNYAYYDRLICADEEMSKYGIKSFVDYERYLDKVYEGNEKAINLEDLKNRAVTLRYQTEEQVRQGITDPDIEVAREEFTHWAFTYAIRSIYLKACDDPFSLILEESGCRYDQSYMLRTIWRNSNKYIYYNGNDDAHYFYPAVESSIKQYMTDNIFNVKLNVITNSANCFMQRLFPIAAACIIAIVLPYALMDKKSRVIPAQFSSKKGRKILNVKLLTVAFAACVITAIVSAVVLVLCKVSLFGEFYDIPINSCFNSDYYSIDISIWQYVFVNIGVSFIVNISIALISFFAGSLCGNYVSAVGCTMLLTLAETMLYVNPLNWLFALPESPAEYIVPIAGVLLVGLAIVVFMKARNRRRAV